MAIKEQTYFYLHTTRHNMLNPYAMDMVLRIQHKRTNISFEFNLLVPVEIGAIIDNVIHHIDTCVIEAFKRIETELDKDIMRKVGEKKTREIIRLIHSYNEKVQKQL